MSCTEHFINTFHANYPLFRWSLDHIFHSADFALIDMRRLSHIGSDHFPVYTVLQSGRKFERIQQPLAQTPADEQAAQQAIQQGIEKAEAEEKVVTDEITCGYKDQSKNSEKN